MRAKRYCYLLFAVILACMMMTAPVLAVDTNTCQHSWEFSYTVQSPTCGSPGTDVSDKKRLGLITEFALGERPCHICDARLILAAVFYHQIGALLLDDDVLIAEVFRC